MVEWNNNELLQIPNLRYEVKTDIVKKKKNTEANIQSTRCAVGINWYSFTDFIGDTRVYTS